MKRQVLPLCVATVCLAASAQSQTRLDWSVFQATPGLDQAHAVVVDRSGNVYAAGAANSDAAQFVGSMFVAAWSAGGAPLWSRSFDASLGGAEFPDAIALDGSGGLYVAGGAVNPQQTQWRGFLLHLDASGSITWSREQSVTGTPSWTPALVVDAAGRAIVGGRAAGPGFGDLSIAAYAPDGTLAWETTYDSGLGAPDEVVDLAIAPNGDILGAATLSRTNGPHPALVRVTPAGQIVHVVPVSDPGAVSGIAQAVDVDANGRVFLAASAQAVGATVPSLALVAFDAQGAESWARTITGPSGPFGGGATASDLEIDPFGRAIVLGARQQGSQGRAAVVAAYDANGNEAWRRIVNDVLGGAATNLWNIPNRLVVTSDGEAIATGLYGPQLADTVADAFVLCFDATGEKRFGITYGFPPTAGNSLDYGIAAAAAPDAGLVIAGRAQTGASSLGFDAFVARFTRTAVGICFGDGSSGACPCGNPSAPAERAGCAHSLGVGGRLADRGASSLSADTFVLAGSAMPDTTVLYFQGTSAAAGAAFGDGLRCAGGTLRRIGYATNVTGSSRYPDAGQPAVSQRGQVTAPGQRVYQAWYRNDAAFCTAAAFNLTNGLRVTWTP